jgi:thioredoxin-like negative regulator of GroEL
LKKIKNLKNKKQLSTKYPNAVFLKVDVDKCPGTAAAYNVSAMPTFIFFRNRAELERLRGANKDQLENKVKQYYSSTATPEKPAEPVDPAAAAGIEGEFVNTNYYYYYYYYY